MLFQSQYCVGQNLDLLPCYHGALRHGVHVDGHHGLPRHDGDHHYDADVDGHHDPPLHNGDHYYNADGLDVHVHDHHDPPRHGDVCGLHGLVHLNHLPRHGVGDIYDCVLGQSQGDGGGCSQHDVQHVQHEEVPQHGGDRDPRHDCVPQWSPSPPSE